MRQQKWIIAVLIVVIALNVIQLLNDAALKRSRLALNLENERLMTQLKSAQEHLAEIEARYDGLEASIAKIDGLSEPFKEQLKVAGHDDPTTFVLNALADRADLIQSAPVLGGTFYFVDIQIIRDGFAFAVIEDGHISGYVLLRFSYDTAADRLDIENIFERLD